MKRWQETISSKPIQEKHPLNQVAQKYKYGVLKTMEAHNEITLDVITKLNEDSVISIKQDGESEVACYDSDGYNQAYNGKLPGGAAAVSQIGIKVMFANGNTLKTELPCLDEFQRVMEQKGYKSAKIAGELVCQAPPGEEMLREGAARAYTDTDPKLIKFFPFDIIELNGQPVIGQYWERMVFVNSMFKDADKSLVEPVYWEKGGENIARNIWNHIVLPRGYEGIVIRTRSGLLKVKVKHDIDLVVIAAKEGADAFTNILGAVYGAFMDRDGVLRRTSAVGTGPKVHERAEWWNWVKANSVGEGTIGNDKVIFVKPTRIISVGYLAVTYSMEPAYKWNETENRYENVGPRLSPILQKLSFMKGKNGVLIREDKEVTPKDLRLEQVPGWPGDKDFNTTPQPNAIAPAVVPQVITPNSIESHNERMRLALLEKMKKRK